MKSIQVKNVPEHAHQVLRRRAAVAGQSLQEYLLQKLIRDTCRPTLEEVLDQVDEYSGGSISLEEAADAVRLERDRN